MRKDIRVSTLGLIIIIALFMMLIACFIYVLKGYSDYKQLNPALSRPDSADCERYELITHLPLDSVSRGGVNDKTNESNARLDSLFNIKYLTELILGPLNAVDGMVGNALAFDGDQWIKAGNKSCHNVQEFTAMVWVLQSDEEVHIPTFLAKSSWPAYDGWWLYTDDNRELGLGIAWGNGYTHVESDYNLPLNEWHHVAITVSNKKNEGFIPTVDVYASLKDNAISSELDTEQLQNEVLERLNLLSPPDYNYRIFILDPQNN